MNDIIILVRFGDEISRSLNTIVEEQYPFWEGTTLIPYIETEWMSSSLGLGMEDERYTYET